MAIFKNKNERSFIFKLDNFSFLFFLLFSSMQFCVVFSICQFHRRATSVYFKRNQDSRSGEGRVDRTKLNVRVGHVGVGALRLDIRWDARVRRTRSTGNTRGRGVRIRRVVGIQPQHLRGVVVWVEVSFCITGGRNGYTYPTNSSPGPYPAAWPLPSWPGHRAERSRPCRQRPASEQCRTPS